MILNASFCNSNSRDAAMRAQRYICDEAKVPLEESTLMAVGFHNGAQPIWRLRFFTGNKTKVNTTIW